jgi:hypothetical protein
MLRLLIATPLLIAVGFFGWNYFKPVPPSVQDQASAVLSQGSCHAIDLARLADVDALTVERTLKGRIFTVSGILSRALTKGVASSDLILELDGTSQRKISFSSDFEQFTRMTRGANIQSPAFQKFGHEVVLTGSRKKSAKPEILLREGDQVSLRGMLLHVGKHNVSFQLRELPKFR